MWASCYLNWLCNIWCCNWVMFVVFHWKFVAHKCKIMWNIDMHNQYIFGTSDALSLVFWYLGKAGIFYFNMEYILYITLRYLYVRNITALCLEDLVAWLLIHGTINTGEPLKSRFTESWSICGQGCTFLPPRMSAQPNFSNVEYLMSFDHVLTVACWRDFRAFIPVCRRLDSLVIFFDLGYLAFMYRLL